MVRLDESSRSDYGVMERLLIYPPEGKEPIALGTLVNIEEGLGPNAVNREDVRRRIVVRVNTLGRDLGSAIEEIQARIRQDVKLPEGYFVEYGGQFEDQQRASWMIPLLGLISVFGMFVVLFMLYPSVRIVLQILNAIPTAFIGGAVALWLTRQTLTVAAMVGFISLGGIAVRNGILLVSHYFHLMRQEGEGFTREMILRGSLERLAPVLMTALTAMIALIPLVVAGHEPGREILYPVATVILGGLITSTFCEFLVHPGIFWRFSGQDADRIAQEEEEAEVIRSGAREHLAEPPAQGDEPGRGHVIDREEQRH
jgi:HME family heavy-metal exporter